MTEAGAGDSGIFEATVHSGRISGRVWRVLGAGALVVLLLVLTDPRANWPLGAAALSLAAALRWWQRRSWDGAAVFLLRRREWDDGVLKGTLLLRPALELLPESMSHIRLEILDRRGRAHTLWRDSAAVDPVAGTDAVPLSFDAPPPPRGKRARWVVSLEANTARGKLTIEAPLPAGVPHTGEDDDL